MRALIHHARKQRQAHPGESCRLRIGHFGDNNAGGSWKLTAKEPKFMSQPLALIWNLYVYGE
jgi:hypothetical protein